MTTIRDPEPAALASQEWFVRFPNGGTVNPRPSTEDTTMPKDLSEMNETSQDLVEAARSAFADTAPSPDAPFDHDLAANATAAVLRKLSELMRPGWENDSGWPDPDDLELLAADITGGGE